jgi:hypothetical protein
MQLQRETRNDKSTTCAQQTTNNTTCKYVKIVRLVTPPRTRLRVKCELKQQTNEAKAKVNRSNARCAAEHSDPKT